MRCASATASSVWRSSDPWPAAPITLTATSTLLYTLAPGARLGWEVEDLTSELEAVLGRRVDLVSRRALHARLQDQVLREAQPFYAAA